jgi:antitoxin component YwqK of YwqJK toxin-antitoxin module
MKQLIRIFFLLLFSITTVVVAQNTKTINHVDQDGLKQGYWEKHYPNGNMQYAGSFINDKPIGILKRYTQEGVLKAEMTYVKNSNKVYSKFYYPSNVLHSKGIYIEKLKDSIWNYYSSEGFKINEVMYRNYKKIVTERKFYPSGNISEISEWTNGVNDGLTIRYYDSKNVMIRILYTNGILNGEYNVYDADEKILIQGQYKNNKREGKWIYYKKNGHIESELNYTNGIADNHEELERLEMEQLELLEKNKGKIQDPTGNIYNTIPPEN